MAVTVARGEEVCKEDEDADAEEKEEEDADNSGCDGDEVNVV